ncbi:MAG TPA: serine/threonine-protein kinase [Gemmatimonadales bacterium]|nr:serine/threonine-protein kinase [Gemmatimonadales bacterium]
MARDLLPMVREVLAGRYTVEREIGRGGAARVFAARTPAGELVALKVLHPQLAVSVTADRFLREVQFVRRLEHPNIARLLDSGEGEWIVYYVMQFVEGPTLRMHLDRVRRASISDTLHIARNLLSALAHAHRQNIVHRDVKPENVVLSQVGAVLVDFGIAKAVADATMDRLTRSGFTVGTSAYMSPEQISGTEDIDPRTDIYSVGCLLFECLAGRPPYDDPHDDLVLTRHRTAPVPDVRAIRADTPEGLALAIARAMAKNRDERWPSAEAMDASMQALTRA